jgi:hypothetical protein
MARLISLLVIIWLVIGALAAYQRDYFADNDTNCAEAGNIALTIVAGPLNYAGVNPKVDCDDVGLPEPSE